MHLIREYTQKDLKDIESIIIELRKFEQFLDPHRLESLEEAKLYLDELLDKCKKGKGKLFVVEIGEEIVGMISVFIEKDYSKHIVDITEYAFISDLMILPDHKKESIAKDLIDAAEQYAREKGVKKVLARVLVNNMDTIHTYRWHSFKEYETIVMKSI